MKNWTPAPQMASVAARHADVPAAVVPAGGPEPETDCGGLAGDLVLGD